MDRSNPTNLAHLFAYGIDAIGRGDYDRGVAMWEEYLTDDYSFKFVFYPGGPSVECPGPECPIKEFDSLARLRADFARDNFQGQGYLATQHQMINTEERSRDGNRAEVFAYVQANHFLPDNVVDVFWGDFSITCVEEGGLWKVQREVIVGTAFIRLQGGAVG